MTDDTPTGAETAPGEEGVTPARRPRPTLSGVLPGPRPGTRNGRGQGGPAAHVGRQDKVRLKVLIGPQRRAENGLARPHFPLGLRKNCRKCR